MVADPTQAPDLTTYDVILANSSGGKDSQTCLRLLSLECKRLGISDRLVVVHADLGRVEWDGVPELARAQAEHYGHRFEIVKRPQGDLLEHVQKRGMWPSPSNRYCTSDHKRGQISRLLTQLTSEKRILKPWRQVRILNCLGMRAQESPARRKMIPFAYDKRASNGRRHVDTWLPIHAWTETEVWADIHASGVPYHFAYDLGMPRLSCVFCIFAPKPALILAGKHNRTLLNAYVAVEQETGHTFRQDFTLADILAAVEKGETPGGMAGNWNM